MKISSSIGQLCVLAFAASATFACGGDTSGDSAPMAGHTGQDITVEEILQRNIEAVRQEPFEGKIENTDKVLRINEAEYSLIARYRASTDGFMRIDVYEDGNRVFSEGKDEMGAWEWPGGKDTPEDVSHGGAAALEHGIEFNLFALAELLDRGHGIELVGRESVSDQEYFVLKVTLSDGFQTYRYVNAETWLVDVARDFRAFHPGIDSTKQNIETRFDRWVRVDGVLFASRSQNFDTDTGEVIATVMVLKSSYNRPREELDLTRNYVPTRAPRPSD